MSFEHALVTKGKCSTARYGTPALTAAPFCRINGGHCRFLHSRGSVRYKALFPYTSKFRILGETTQFPDMQSIQLVPHISRHHQVAMVRSPFRGALKYFPSVLETTASPLGVFQLDRPFSCGDSFL
jgi:hypothetical protein